MSSGFKKAILITTKNRKEALLFTLHQSLDIINREDVECVVYDDGSTDGTYDAVKLNFPEIRLHRNEISKGYIFCRNRMLNESEADYAISLDDDAHFLSENPLEKIENYFEQNPACGLIAFRIFWGESSPNNQFTAESIGIVKGFVGCGHVWRLKSWNSIPVYPEWFVFYGEEKYASLQLFKNGFQIHYLPSVLVQHRVNVKTRKSEKDYRIRLRRSLRSDWYLYLMFYPYSKIPRIFLYTLWIQFKNKILKGDFKAAIAVIQALGDVIINFHKIVKGSNRFTKEEFVDYQNLGEPKIYWKPER